MTTPILLAPQPLDLLDATIEPVADGEVAVRTAAGYVSVQPNGTVETRTAIGLWERATRIGVNLVRYDGAGYVQYFFVQETAVTPPVPVPVPAGPPPNIRTTDRAAVELRVRYWLGTIGQETEGNVTLWMDYIFDVAGEHHDIGWTADEPNNYWTVKILTGDYA